MEFILYRGDSLSVENSETNFQGEKDTGRYFLFYLTLFCRASQTMIRAGVGG